MYKLLIVDDEEYVVNWLSEMFMNLEEAEFEVYSAFSGLQAIQITNSVKPDIVISDINMPGMDGLTLGKQIKDRWPQTYIVFLSGHAKFEYAYEAIQQEHVRYLLKIEKDEKILATVLDIVKEIQGEESRQQFIAEVQQMEMEVLPVLKKEFFCDWISGSAVSHNLLAKNLMDWNIDIRLNQRTYMFISVLLSSMNKSDKNYHQLELIIKNLIQKSIDGQFRYLSVPVEKYTQVWILQPKDNIDFTSPVNLIKQNLESVQNIYNQNNGHVAFSIYDEDIALNQVPKTYLKLRDLLNANDWRYPVTILSHEQKVTDRSDDKLFETFEAACVRLRNLRRLELYLEQNNEELFFKELGKYTDLLKQVNSLHYVPALEMYTLICATFLAEINRANLLHQIAFRIGISNLTNISYFENWPNACLYLEQLARAIFEIRASSAQTQEKDVCNVLIEYINGHLEQDVSLTVLSSITKLNASYLSRLFKQQVGVNISEYINFQRIEKAKTILRSTEHNVTEVAEMVGFNSVSYFSKRFKTIVGVLPNQYRKG